MKKLFVGVLASLLAVATPALAGNTNILTENGTQVFPLTAPTTNPAAPGTMTNMVQVKCTATGASPQTCNGTAGLVTSGTLTTALSTDASFTINDSSVTATNGISCSLTAYSGTLGTNGDPVLETCVPGAGTITINFRNVNAANALNGTLTFGFVVF